MADKSRYIGRMKPPEPKPKRAPRPKNPRQEALNGIVDMITRFALSQMSIDEADELAHLDRSIAILTEVGKSLARNDRAKRGR